MRLQNRYFMTLAASTGLLLFLAGATFAQGTSGSAAGAASNSSLNKNIGKDKSPISTENYLNVIKPPEPGEQKAYDGFSGIASNDTAKKVQAGEKFLKDFPQSQFAMYVYSYLVIGYVQSGQMDKALDAGTKDLQLNPKDIRTMGVLSQSLARAFNPSAPNAAEQLSKAADYGKKALDGAVALSKPEGMSDADFEKLKTESQAMAHSGLGLVSLRAGKYAEAIPELESAIALNATDQTNFYLLGVAHQNSKHSSEAVAAFKKCASLPGNLQATCSSAAAQK